MSISGEADGRDAEVIQPDVLIIGGGVQGLWLLNDLRRQGYSAVLLERRELGGGQTCHSHVYLHQGHLYREVRLAEHLKGVTGLWAEWLREHPVRRAVMPSCFGFLGAGDAQTRVRLWSHPDLGLPYEAVPVPPALEGGVIRHTLQSPEICLEGQSLVEELSRPVEPWISRIEDVTDVRLDPKAERVTEVTAAMPGGTCLKFRPRALVLAAGAGNQALLDRATGGSRALAGRLRDQQQIRKGHMLVVSGPAESLGALSGVFPHCGLFLVARREGSEVTWLISDDRSPLLGFVEDWLEYDTRAWLPQVIAALRQVAPRYFTSPERLRWGIYEAPKAEGRALGFVPGEERIEQFRIPNLWVLWPTKLTLAPKVGAEVLGQLGQLIDRPNPWAGPQPLWESRRVRVAVAPERWRKTPLTSWDEFRRCHNLSQ
jgi:glycine/D-amino acid oxidase-like deaminating enzyme